MRYPFFLINRLFDDISLLDFYNLKFWLVPKSNNIAAGVSKMLPEARQRHQRTYKKPIFN